MLKAVYAGTDTVVDISHAERLCRTPTQFQMRFQTLNSSGLGQGPV
jgi:hypothetical protein